MKQTTMGSWFKVFVAAALALCASGAFADDAAEAVKAVERRAEVAVRLPPRIRTSGIAAYSTNHQDYALNNGLGMTAKGRLWASWIAGEDGGGAYTVASRSDDGGDTWSDVELVIDDHAKDDTDRTNIIGTFWLDPKGGFHIFTDQSLGHFDGRAGIWESVCEDPDAAETRWAPMRRLGHGHVMNKPIVLANGNWAMSGYLNYRKWGTAAEKTAFADLNPERGATCYVSKDAGATWEKRGTVAFPGIDWQESQIVQLKGGALRVYARVKDGDVGKLMVADSADEGRTWTKPYVHVSMDNPNTRFQVMRLKSGRLLFVKNGAPGAGGRAWQDRDMLTAYLSDDDGATWRGGLVLYAGASSYPDACQGPDGTIYVTHDHDRGGAAEIWFHRFTEEDVLAKRVVSKKGRLGVLVSRRAASAKKAAASAKKGLFVLHLDFNVSTLNKAAILKTLEHAAKQGCNAVLWEIENAVRFDCCPETASPDAFTKDEFRAILAEAKKLGLEPIPLMQTFGHGEYVLTHDRFKPLRERADRKDCYCPSKPETRAFLKKLLHEYLEIFGSDVKRFHLGGDEAWVYQSCAACKARDAAELYVEHLLAVAEELRAKGIRPGVWHDMLCSFDRKGGSKYALLPKDFTIWFWDYGSFGKDGWARGHEEPLRREIAAGRDVVFCASTRSWIDSPFMVRYGFHRANLATSIDALRDVKLAGYCVTSWIVHQSSLELQYPLFDFAAKRWLRPGADAAGDWREIVAAYYGDGGLVAALDDLTAWDCGLVRVDGRYGECKDGVVLPPGAGRGKVAALAAGEAAKKAAALRALTANANKALDVLRPAARTPFMGLACEAGALKVAYQEMLANALEGKPAPTADFPTERARAFYRREMGEASARRAVERIRLLYDASRTE